jgi:hypothetical protein
MTEKAKETTKDGESGGLRGGAKAKEEAPISAADYDPNRTKAQDLPDPEESARYAGDGTDANAAANEPEGAIKSGYPQHYGIAGGESYAKD